MPWASALWETDAVAATTAPQLATSALVAPKPIVAKPPPRDPLKDYTPLSVRKVTSDEDWLMEDVKSA